MLFRETTAVYCENHKKHKNTLSGQDAEFQYVKAVVHIVTMGFKGLIFEETSYALLQHELTTGRTYWMKKKWLG
jgi:hypothetical protein